MSTAPREHGRPHDPITRPSRGRPPLQSGDRLTRDEFERRAEALPDGAKAELVDGVAHLMTPVSERHCGPHAILCCWLTLFAVGTPGTFVGDNGTVRLPGESSLQPDLYLRRREGGATRLGPDAICEGPPELVVEIAATSANIDLHAKLDVYRRGGVQEYLVWRTYDDVVDWFELRSGVYHSIEAGPEGLMKSRVFPGLWLDAASLLQGSTDRVLEVLQEGLASPEHRAFVALLGAPPRGDRA